MTPSRREPELRALREAVRIHAERRHGIFTRSDLDALGIDAAKVRSFTRRGWWTRVHYGVYIDTDTLSAATDSRARLRIQASAAVAALEGPAYVFGPSAAQLHDLAVDRRLRERLSLVRPTESDQRAFGRRVAGPSLLASVSVHRYALTAEQVTAIDGIPVVDALDAAITAAAASPLMWAVATLDSLLWRDPQAVERFPACLGRWSRLRGAGTARRAAELARWGAQTPLESISRFAFSQGGLPEPVLQMPVYDEEGLIGHVDMAWPDMRVIGEADGLLKYRDRSDLIAEKAREDRLRAQGWIVVRWTWDEILRTPDIVIARIRRAFAQARARSA